MKKAVKVGYIFGIFEEEELRNISLSPIRKVVCVEGTNFQLHIGKTVYDSVRIDRLLGKYPDREKRIDDYEEVIL